MKTLKFVHQPLGSPDICCQGCLFDNTEEDCCYKDRAEISMGAFPCCGMHPITGANEDGIYILEDKE